MVKDRSARVVLTVLWLPWSRRLMVAVSSTNDEQAEGIPNDREDMVVVTAVLAVGITLAYD